MGEQRLGVLVVDVLHFIFIWVFGPIPKYIMYLRMIICAIMYNSNIRGINLELQHFDLDETLPA